MTSDRFCWLKGLFETSHFEKRFQKRSEDQMYNFLKNSTPPFFQGMKIVFRWIIFSFSFGVFQSVLRSVASLQVELRSFQSFQAPWVGLRFFVVGPRRNDGAKTRNLWAHLGGCKSQFLVVDVSLLVGFVLRKNCLKDFV